MSTPSTGGQAATTLSSDGAVDAPFVFGHLPTTAKPLLFSTLQLARLMILRSRLEANRAATS